MAGAVWLVVGLVLASVGLRFVLRTEPSGESSSAVAIALALGLGAVLGGLKGRFVLSRSARRNMARIERLPAPRVWQVFGPRMALLILLMIGLGRLLRAAAAAGWLGGYLGVGAIYVGIGSALVVSSWAYFAPPRVPLPTRLDGPPRAQPRDPAAPREHGAPPRGVLLVNLGSPDAPTPPAVRRYLRQFLGDPRVVKVNRVLWAFVLNVIILPFRSRASAELYRTIWTPEGSPLLVNGRELRERLARRLGADRTVVLGMRYGRPDLGGALAELRAAGCRSAVVLPLFPQYSETTTGSVFAELERLQTAEERPLRLELVRAYGDDPVYLDALAARAARHDPGDFTVFSFHGIPEAYVRDGDPYLEECGRTAWGLAERLGLARDSWEMAFQSRFGDEPWLQPYLDELVPALAPTHPRVRVIAPSFTADCLETLEEIGVRLAEAFHAAGGRELIVVPCLNADEEWVEALADLVERPWPAAERRAR